MAGSPVTGLGDGLLAVGTLGGDRCVDGTELAPGVHLLWTLAPGLGFPVGGYSVARRTHRPPEWLRLAFDQAGLPDAGRLTWSWQSFTLTVSAGPVSLDQTACGPAPGLALPGARTLTVDCAQSGVAVWTTGTGTPPVIEAVDAGAGPEVVLARRTADTAPGGWSLQLWATGVTRVRITGDDLVACTLSIGLAVTDGGWQPLTAQPILVPLVPPGTRNLAELVDDRSATVTRARSRLPSGLPAAIADELAGDFADAPRDAVALLLREGPGARLPGTASVAEQARDAPRLGVDVDTVLTLAALDANLARMLGLTWHDPAVAGLWDYRVVAHYRPVLFPGTAIRFDELLPGPQPAGVVRVAGLTVVSSGGLTVLVASDGAAVLRMDPPLPGAPGGLMLPPRVRSVRLWLATAGDADGITFTGRRGDRTVVSVVGDGGDVIVLEDATGLDTVTWDRGRLDLAEVELSGTAGPVGDHAWYAWNVAAADPTPVGALTVTDVGADAAVPPPGPDGRLPRWAGVVGVDWQPADDVRDAGSPVRALVAFSAPAGSADHATDGPFTVVNADRPATAAARVPGSVGTWPGPQVPRRWTRPLADAGWYAVRVRGVDAFGRLGPWTVPRTVQVGGAPEPGAPDALSARYLDPADPDLTDADRALSGGTPGLLVKWTWPAGRRLQAPAVDTAGEFRVYLRRGEPNLVSGTVLQAIRDTDRSRLDTDVDWPGRADALTGQLLRLGGASYPILGHGRGAGTSFEVGHLSSPLRRPGTGPFTITLSPTAPPYVGFNHATDFDRRVAVAAGNLAAPTTTTVRTVVPTIRGAKVTLADPVVVDPGAAPVPGLLLSRGIGYPVLDQPDGSAELQIGAATQPGGGRLLPAVGDRCTVWCGGRYQLWLPGITVAPGDGEAFAVAFVGVAAADGDPLVADDPRWDAPGRGGLGGRPGRQGPTGRAARVAVPHRGGPPVLPVTRPPDVDGDVPAVLAEPADWYGQAHYRVPLDPVGGSAGYRVLRASTAALFAYDAQLRRTGRDPYADGPFPHDAGSVAWLAERYPPVTTAELTADPTTLDEATAAAVAGAWRDWSAWFYPQLSNREVMDLSDLDTHREPFLPTHPGTVPGPSFLSTMDGRGTGRFLYRIRTVDASGVAGPWSATLPIVELRDVTPPKSPTLLSVLGGEDEVSLAWRANTEPDLAGYRIWRSTDPADLADVRRRPAYAQVPANAGPLWTVWTDGGLAPLTRWFYRVAAFDRTGNVSAPTDVVSARPIHTAPPEPPTWTAAGREGSAVALAWSVEEDGVVCMVERQRFRERLFTARTGWLAPDRGPRGFAWRDDDPGSGPVSYRIRARDVTGNEQRYRWNPVAVPAAEEGT